MDWATKDPAFKGPAFPLRRCLPDAQNARGDPRASSRSSHPARRDIARRNVAGIKSRRADERHARLDHRPDRFTRWRRSSSPAPMRIPRCRDCASCGIAAWRSASICSAKPASATTKPHLSTAISRSDRKPFLTSRKLARQSLLDPDHLGPIPRANVSIKISSLYAHTKAIDTEGSIRGLVGRFTRFWRPPGRTAS